MIAMVESTPTALRKKEELKRIQEKAGGELNPVGTTAADDEPEGESFTIKF